MSVTLYDTAVKKKIQGWVLDNNMTILAPDEVSRLYQWKADTTNDAPIELPLIAITRDRDFNIRITAKRAMSHEGLVFNSEDGISDHLNAIPITINYNINIYTRTLEQADEYMRNFVFNLINYPTLKIEIPYNDSKLEYTSFLTLQPEVSDNSDIPERLIAGQFSRMTVRFALNDAYLFSYNHKKVSRVSDILIKSTIYDGSPGKGEYAFDGFEVKP